MARGVGATFRGGAWQSSGGTMHEEVTIPELTAVVTNRNFRVRFGGTDG